MRLLSGNRLYFMLMLCQSHKWAEEAEDWEKFLLFLVDWDYGHNIRFFNSIFTNLNGSFTNSLSEMLDNFNNNKSINFSAFLLY